MATARTRCTDRATACSAFGDPDARRDLRAADGSARGHLPRASRHPLRSGMAATLASSPRYAGTRYSDRDKNHAGGGTPHGASAYGVTNELQNHRTANVSFEDLHIQGKLVHARGGPSVNQDGSSSAVHRCHLL